MTSGARISNSGTNAEVPAPASAVWPPRPRRAASTMPALVGQLFADASIRQQAGVGIGRIGEPSPAASAAAPVAGRAGRCDWSAPPGASARSAGPHIPVRRADVRRPRGHTRRKAKRRLTNRLQQRLVEELGVQPRHPQALPPELFAAHPARRAGRRAAGAQRGPAIASPRRRRSRAACGCA